MVFSHALGPRPKTRWPGNYQRTEYRSGSACRNGFASVAARGGNVNIVAIPGSHERSVNFGVMAAQALEDRKVDGFWANGMGAELAVRRGVGTVVLDVRRGDGPHGCFNFTMPVIVTSEHLIEREPEAAAGAIKAVMATQMALSGAEAFSEGGSQSDRRACPTRSAVLRSHNLRSFRDRNDRLCTVGRSVERPFALRPCRRAAVPPPLDSVRSHQLRRL